jgi:hypothetical protein
VSISWLLVTLRDRTECRGAISMESRGTGAQANPGNAPHRTTWNTRSFGRPQARALARLPAGAP